MLRAEFRPMPPLLSASVLPPVRPSVRLFVRPYVRPFYVRPSVCPSFRPSVRTSVRPSPMMHTVSETYDGSLRDRAAFSSYHKTREECGERAMGRRAERRENMAIARHGDG
ncbi:hypothetical protein KIN20_015367 [Parelaphostrongylus tenuis]|uniref:Uncharacterized protein n=1 Tax=Parelaphostrongylus tenuis TaxID=148309 RepID=A0AAD5MX98_PARTN|nr:hypothetical protein KIN20_015367 [Parelaphostrongylus tenuis]